MNPQSLPTEPRCLRAWCREPRLCLERFPAVAAGVLLSLLCCGHSATAQTNPSAVNPAPGCVLVDRFFDEEVWAKVGERTCLKCHNENGDAADSSFILSSPEDTGSHGGKGTEQNRAAFETAAKATEGDQSRLLLKVTGGLDHGGGEVLKADSTGYRILERLVHRLHKHDAPASGTPVDDSIVTSEYNALPFFDGVTMISPRRLLRRVVPFIPKEQAKERLAQQADIALAAFKGGVGISANLSIGQFDSHNNNDPDQMKLIPEFLAGIDYVLRKAEDLQIRDKLVVIIQSEMGRTPTYNNGNGTDHWSIGSVMFLGPGITGNRVIGATDEKQLLVPINPQTLDIDKDHGIRTRPEHIHQALREYAGIQDHAFSKQFPLNVAATERLKRLLT